MKVETAMLASALSKSQPRIWVFAGLACLLSGMSLILYFFDPNQYSFYPRCLFHQTTGLFCPGCGSLRAIHQLLHGHLMAAARLNALLVLSLPVVLWMAARQILAGFMARLPTPAFRRWFLWIGLAILIFFSLLRNFSFARGWLAP